jgi:hypothetical protein
MIDVTKGPYIAPYMVSPINPAVRRAPTPAQRAPLFGPEVLLALKFVDVAMDLPV